MQKKNKQNEIKKSSLILYHVLFLGLTPAIEAAVKIISPTTNQIIKYRNQSVLFNCTLITSASSSGGNFRWLKDSAVIQPVHRKNSSFWSSFELKKFSALDEGEYSCNDGQSHDSVIVHLACMYLFILI